MDYSSHGKILKTCHPVEITLFGSFPLKAFDYDNLSLQVFLCLFPGWLPLEENFFCLIPYRVHDKEWQHCMLEMLSLLVI